MQEICMESYIVRIYRRSETIPHKLIGIVEEVEDGGKRAFTNLQELWEILNPVKMELIATKRKRAPGKKT
jgi:hypothetical protein